MLTVRTFSGLGELKEHREQWDALAVAASRPLAAPAVVGAWWERLRPPKASLQVITVWDDATVVGILPLVREGHLYSWPGGHVMTVEPLARPGMEDDIAAAIARGLADLRPGPYRIELELQGDSPQWATLLSRAWPGRWDLRDRQVRAVAMPRVDFDGDDFEAWMAAKSANFRKDMKRKRRRLEEAGGRVRLSDEATLRHDVEELVRLHLARQEGESALAAPGTAEMMIDMGTALLPLERFRLICAELEGRMIASLLLVAAGPVVSAWVSGFDDAFGRFSPNMVTFMHAIEDMLGRGERTLNLGPGEQRYKYRFASSEEQLVTHALAPLLPRDLWLRGVWALRLRARTLIPR